MDWFTGCTHFGHDKIRKLSNRPFDNVDEMDSKIIDNINKVVGVNDNLWILGDFCFGGYQDVSKILSLIDCKSRFLILGNHDKLKPQQYKDAGFSGVYNYHEIKRTIDERGKKIVLFHYPIHEWNAYYHGSWHLHSHTHNFLTDRPHGLSADFCRMDVGVDAQQYIPVSLDYIKEVFQGKENPPNKRNLK